jgi:hypothetical protein
MPERGAAFFSIGATGESMFGLWSLGSTPRMSRSPWNFVAAIL